MGKPHALVIPFPVQGHVIPLMELSHRLIDRGFKVTFVNSDYNHARVVAALRERGRTDNFLRLVSIPDGLTEEDDRNDVVKICEAIYNSMPNHLEDLIKKINESEEEDKITCVLADVNMAPSFIVAEKMGIRSASFWPAAAGLLALNLHVTELLEMGILDGNGLPTKQQMVRVSPDMPEINTDHFSWTCNMGDVTCNKIIFDFVVKTNQVMKLADWVLCNSFQAIEGPALKLIPKSLPIGPLLSSSRTEQPVGHFWPEDSSCLSWLDQQRPGSVVYVAFGSLTLLNQRQLLELAHGLELTGRPFLWVVRPDLMDGSSVSYPDGYEERVATQGKLVSWAPQQKVLANPSVGCFVSHCGWNSTTEGMSNGLPFLCWPYFCDQFLNQNYLCDVWKVGFGLEADVDGIITREEIKNKVEDLMNDEGIRTRALKLKEIVLEVLREGGPSWKNLNDFVEALR